MKLPKNDSERAQYILQALWQRFSQQPVVSRLLTLLVILCTLLWITVFYFSFVAWRIFSFIMNRILLRALEWYLHHTEKRT